MRGLILLQPTLYSQLLTYYVPEGTPVPYPIHQFQVTHAGVNGFRLNGEGSEDIKISEDGWLFLDKPLDWSRDNHYIIGVEALQEGEVVDGPIYVTINVLDVNNHAPYFNNSDYVATVRENNPAGVPFTRVFALDQDDPQSPNAHLRYSLVSQIPNKHNVLLFQINPDTGEISTTEEGQQMLKAREGIIYSRGEDQSIEALKSKFDQFCTPVKSIPYEENPFYTCVERAGLRRNVDPLEDPDYTLIVRVQDLGGTSATALSGSTKVNIVVKQNLWVNPGPITVREHLEGTYPMVLTKSNDPNAVYRLVQKERDLKFPFRITPDGDVQLTEELDREDKGMYILVVLAQDDHGNEVDPPMEIQVIVEDINDNRPMCEHEETVFEVQEDEPVGSLIGQLLAHDDDEPGTMNSQLTYTIHSQNPPSEPNNAFSIDSSSGRIQALQTLQRKDAQMYHLTVKVSDPAFSTDCKVIVRVIDVNNELPLFERSDYGSHSLAEDAPVGHTLVSVRATDADDPGSGSSRIEFHISEGNDDEVFAVETDGDGVGKLVIAKPLDFESSSTYRLKIDARNPEPLMKGLEYGSDSSTFVSVSVTDVDEAPEFNLDNMEVTVPENTTKGATLLKVEAKDPEGKEIRFKLDGDTEGWLEIDAATGEIKTKAKLDRETMETFDLTVIAYEKDNPEHSSEQVVSVRLLDVNDNYPTLMESYAFICMKKPQPVIIKAQDPDNAPFSQPFTFSFAHGKKSPNWDLKAVDGSTAKLVLKKIPTEDKTFTLPINIKDNAGMGITHSFEVQVCNCTQLGYCYIAPGDIDFRLGMGATIGILAGILGLCGESGSSIIGQAQWYKEEG
uniref:Cadherin domain-containing protein n=1 Tax=Sphaeramia orbicularis TaxID=375764 RepID=A0A673B2G8_9TELE